MELGYSRYALQSEKKNTWLGLPKQETKLHQNLKFLRHCLYLGTIFQIEKTLLYAQDMTKEVIGSQKVPKGHAGGMM